MVTRQKAYRQIVVMCQWVDLLGYLEIIRLQFARPILAVTSDRIVYY